MARQKFLKWCCTTLPGHLVLVALPFWIALSITFLLTNYLDGALTVSSVLRIVSTCLVGGIILAVLIWFTLTAPLIRATNQKKKNRDLVG